MGRFENPNLIVTTIATPQANFRSLFGLVAENIHNKSCERFESNTILNVGWNDLPEFVFLFVWLADMSSRSLMSFWNFDCQAVQDTENSPFSVSNVLE